MKTQIEDTIIKTLGLDALPEGEQREALAQMAAVVYQEVILRALAVMDDEDKEKFDEILSTTNDPDVLLVFLAQKLPNLNEIVEDEANKLKKETGDIMSQIG